MTRSLFVAVIAAFIHWNTLAQQVPVYRNPKAAIDERVNDLLGRMTVEEKFWQLFMIPGDLDDADSSKYKNGIFGFQVTTSQGSPSQQLIQYQTDISGLALLRRVNSIQKYFVERTHLGIPIIAFDEALHGLLRQQATVFPQSIGLAATFDTTMMHSVADAIALETKARGIRQVLSPVINIASDVRWGRVEETYGEDPFLTSEMGVAFVSAFEKRNVITTPKHLIANVGDGGRDSYPIHFNERLLEEIHFPPFKACFERGHSRSVMTSYNSVDGTPSTSNSWLLNKKLKSDWHFNGFVISDASATGGANVLHMTSPDYATSGQQAINAGLDIIFQTAYEHYKLFIPHFLDGGVSLQRLNDAVSRVLRAKFELGLFENPYVAENEMVQLSKSNAHKEIATQAARESIVLLKNQGNILPISKSIKSIAVIGKAAKEVKLGGYSGPGNGTTSILDGIKKLAGQAINVAYSQGYASLSGEMWVVPSTALRSDNNNGLKGEYFNEINYEGAPTLTRTDKSIDFHWTLGSPDPLINNHFYSARWTGTIQSVESGTFKIGLEGNDGFRLYVDGKLVIDKWIKQSYSVTAVGFHFEKDKPYTIRIEFHEPIGNAHLKLIWNAGHPSGWQEQMKEAVVAAEKSDVAVIVTEILEGEFQDRAMLGLPYHQEDLIREIAATGKPVVVVLVGGSAITMSAWIEKVNGIIDVWYPGEEGGVAVAEVLFGVYNPAGRLPLTFPLHEAQLPLVYNHKPTGRGDDYNNLSGYPLFPFGFGLSYTSFEYAKLRIDKGVIGKTESTHVRLTIKNSGRVDGDEVVQLYIRDEMASVARPVMELKGFTRIHLKAGESKEVSFTITPAALMMLNEKMEWVVEPGSFRLMVGASARDIRVEGRIVVRE